MPIAAAGRRRRGRAAVGRRARPPASPRRPARGRVGADASTSRTEPGDPRRDARMIVCRRRLLRARAGARRAGQRRHRAAGASWRERARAPTARPRSAGRAARDPAGRRRPGGWRDGAITDAIEGASPLGSRVDAAGRPRLAARRRRGRVPRPVHRRGPPSGARVGRAGGRGDRRGTCAAAPPARSPPTTGRCAAGSRRRTRLACSSRRSSPGRRCSTTRPGGSRREPRP